MSRRIHVGTNVWALVHLHPQVGLLLQSLNLRLDGHRNDPDLDIAGLAVANQVTPASLLDRVRTALDNDRRTPTARPPEPRPMPRRPAPAPPARPAAPRPMPRAHDDVLLPDPDDLDLDADDLDDPTEESSV
jgi:hypothetical protein